VAESVNADPITSSPQTKPKKKSNKLLEGVSSFLHMTTWILVGLVFLFLGIIFKIKQPVPAAWMPFFNQYIPNLPYFISGFGFLCLGHARSMVRKQYIAEQKKDVLFSHVWKIPLLRTQVLILYGAGLYAILFGLNFVHAVGMLGLVSCVALFFIYLVLYQIEYFKNRLQAGAALRITMMAFVLSGLSFWLWTAFQMIIPSLILAFLGIFSGIYGLSYSGTVAQKGGWLKYILAIGAVAFLSPIAYYALDLRNSQTDALDTVVVAQGLGGEIENLVYSSKGNQIAFNQKISGQWSLRTIGSNILPSLIVKLPEVDDSFHSVFVEGGKSLLIDAPTEGERKLVKVNASTGALSVLVQTGLEPFSGGLPWLEATQEFLFVTAGGKGYNLNAWTPEKAKSMILYSSPTKILSPSWLSEGEVVFVDGIHSTPCVLNLKTKTTKPVILDEHVKAAGELIEKDPLIEVLPSPDHFRYLCESRKNGKTTLWTMLMDGTKRQELVKTDDQLSEIAWSTDAQKIVFQKDGVERGFTTNIKGVEVLDANLGTIDHLIPQQISSHSPAVSPDGIKIAFVASDGLWYPSLDSGIWVMVLR